MAPHFIPHTTRKGVREDAGEDFSGGEGPHGWMALTIAAMRNGSGCDRCDGRAMALPLACGRPAMKQDVKEPSDPLIKTLDLLEVLIPPQKATHLSSLGRNLGGGALLRRLVLLRTLTTLLWMAALME